MMTMGITYYLYSCCFIRCCTNCVVTALGTIIAVTIIFINIIAVVILIMSSSSSIVASLRGVGGFRVYVFRINLITDWLIIITTSNTNHQALKA